MLDGDPCSQFSNLTRMLLCESNWWRYWSKTLAKMWKKATSRVNANGPRPEKPSKTKSLSKLGYCNLLGRPLNRFWNGCWRVSDERRLALIKTDRWFFLYRVILFAFSNELFFMLWMVRVLYRVSLLILYNGLKTLTKKRAARVVSSPKKMPTSLNIWKKWSPKTRHRTMVW